MAFIANDFTWVPVSRGIRTRIAQGPLVHAAPVQWLVFGSTARNMPVNFFVNVYSAAAPWSLASSGTGTAWILSTTVTGALSTFRAPWDSGFPLWLSSSPWIEVVVVTNINCMAHLEIL